jgi:hypothetical protein
VTVTALQGRQIPIGDNDGDIQFVAPDGTRSVVVTVLVETTDTAAGCASCGAQGTVLLHPHHGRQCPDHITPPPGQYRHDLADDMVDLGRADAAFAYLRAWVAREIDARFAAVRALDPLTAGRLTSGVLTADIVLASHLTTTRPVT